jgi:hypothetical protein
MGGAVWQPEEEEYFWTKVVPQSDKKIGYDRETDKDDVKTWDELAREMKAHFAEESAKAGKNPIREYSTQALSEHSPCLGLYSH